MVEIEPKTDRCEQEFISVCFSYNGKLLAVRRMAD